MMHSKLPSERKFGILFVIVILGLGVYGGYKGWSQSACAALFIVGVFVGLTALFFPKLLKPFSLAWFWLGYLLGMIVSPIVLGALFFGILSPVAFITRLFGRDELRLHRRIATSYWIDRNPPELTADSFKNQF